MSAVLAVIDETVRLYSKPSASPVDVVAPQHAQIHGELERWGAWNRERYRPRTADSKEGEYRRTRAGDQGGDYPRLPVSLPASERNRQIDRAVLRMPIEHRAAVRLFYVDRRAPQAICRQVAIHWNDFPRWMFDCRAMVLNLLRQFGA